MSPRLPGLRGLRSVTWADLGGGARAMRLFMNAWPPFLAAGVVVEEISPDFRRARVALHLRFWSRNYVGTLFGGSLFAMTDPFWMLLVLRSIGPGYTVWDRAGEIEFLRPGRSTVRAQFVVTDEVLEELRQEAADGSRVLRWFETDVVAEDGTVVARVRKQLYVRRATQSQSVPAGSPRPLSR